jgi:hypothetical protein
MPAEALETELWYSICRYRSLEPLGMPFWRAALVSPFRSAKGRVLSRSERLAMADTPRVRNVQQIASTARSVYQGPFITHDADEGGGAKCCVPTINH